VAVSGHIVEQGKAAKIIVFKYKRRKRFRRKQGHRQQYTAIKIDKIAT
jgi:large subunit ribosomal protein L21